MLDRRLLENGDLRVLEDGVTYRAIEPPPQFGRPDGVDDSSGNWTGSPDNTNLHNNINEVTPSDAETVTSPNNPAAGVYIVFSISNLETPETPTQGHVFRYRMGKSDTTGRTIDVTVALMQGTTEVASWPHPNIDLPETYEQTLTSQQAAAITDYQDLRFRFDPTVSGGGAGRSAVLSWAELEVPYGEAAAGQNLNRSASDTVSVSDSPARLVARTRTSTDTVSVTESPVRLIARTRTTTDTVAIGSDTAQATHQSGSVHYPRSATDTVSVTDSAVAEVRGPSQFVTAVADIATGGWTGEDGRSTNLYPSISDDNAATYIKSPQAPVAADAATFGIESAIDPETHLGHILRYWYSAQGSVTLVVDLMEGSTLIASWQHVNPSTTPTQAVQTLSTAEAAAITNYTNLRVRFRGA